LWDAQTLQIELTQVVSTLASSAKIRDMLCGVAIPRCRADVILFDAASVLVQQVGAALFAAVV